LPYKEYPLRELELIVREATLDDTKDIVEVHLTNPDRPFDRPVESLSIAERYGYGGSWMSVESGAIHLNNMLAWGYVPLVVEDEGKVIAEAEFYIGKDIPPLGTTLDISVLYVHSDFQRRGAGSLLMHEMISRAEREKCRYITVSGGLGAPGFYARFGFSHILSLEAVDCSVPEETDVCTCVSYTPEDFEELPKGSLWIGRFLSPCQKWREIVDAMKRRDIILLERADWPRPEGRYSKPDEFLSFLVPEWKNRAKADVYCWSEELKPKIVSDLLSHARLAGYNQACLLCHPKVAKLVGEVCKSTPRPSWQIWGKELTC